MPSKEAEDSEGSLRPGTGQLKSWLGGLGKKAKDAEAFKVPPTCTISYHIPKFASSARWSLCHGFCFIAKLCLANICQINSKAAILISIIQTTVLHVTLY